jgi:hypothetical protein
MNETRYRNRDTFDVVTENVEKIIKKLSTHAQIIAGIRNANPKKTIGQYATLQRILRNSYQQYVQKKEGANYSFINRLENLKDKFLKGELSETEFYLASNGIIDKLEQFDKAIMQKVAQTNERFNAVSKNTEDQSQRLVEMRDAMLKKRLFYLFLVVAPFLPIPFLDTITNTLATMFDPNMTYGESMSNLVKSDQLGFLGDVIDFLEIDKVIQLFFDKTPIVSDIFGTIDDIAGSNLVYGTAQTISPMLSSPLPYAPLAIGAALMGSAQEVKFVSAKNKSYNKQKKMIEKALHDANKSFEKVFDKTAKEAMENNFNLIEKANKIKRILDFIILNSADDKTQILIEKILNDIPELKALSKEKDEQKILPILCGLEDKFVDKALTKILVHDKLFFEKIYDQMQQISKEDKNKKCTLEVGRCSVKSLLEDYENFESFKDSFLSELSNEDLKKFKDFTRTIGIYDLAETHADRNLERISKDQDQKEFEKISQPLLTYFQKNFASEIEDKYYQEFSKHCQSGYLDFSRDDYYERVKEVYMKAFGKEISSNASHKVIEDGLVPARYEVGRGIEPMQLGTPNQTPNREELRNDIKGLVPWGGDVKVRPVVAQKLQKTQGQRPNIGG